MAVRGTSKFIDRYRAALTAWDAARSTARVWAKDASLWTNSGEDRWLGWLDLPAISNAQLDGLRERVLSSIPRDATDVLLIGMGGSSLAPEVIAKVVPRGADGRSIRILDSTEPSFVRAALDGSDWTRTIAVVASKSGSTLEPDILLSAALEHARAQVGALASGRFLAITDPGSRLRSQASDLGFATVIDGDPTIGGRFSALSPFGLVPAVLHGADLTALTQSAAVVAKRCRDAAPANPGVQLGVFLATAALAGRDKCTLVLSSALAPLGAWIEQLVAESTGKAGVAILPIDGERLGDRNAYGDDRALVVVRDPGVVPSDQMRIDALVERGVPAFVIDAGGADALGAEFFRWEFATAVAGALLHVNPFDQPDVESAKVATRALTDSYERGDVVASVDRPALDPAAIRVLFTGLRPGDYVAILAFLPMTRDVDAVLQRTRMRVRDAKRVATMLGFGPRYLHSTGQAFKGGPNTGVFIQLTWTAPADLAIPGRRATFGTVVAAQAAGDRQVLRERGRRVVHVHLEGELAVALEGFDAAVRGALE